MSRRLWLIGGTQESRWLVEKITAYKRLTHATGPPVVVTVTTEAARCLYPKLSAVIVRVGQLVPEQADIFVQQQQIGAILDVSHPFALEISQLAIALSHRYGLPYLRYERPAPPSIDWTDRQGRPGNVLLPRLSDVLSDHYLDQARSLLALGYQRLADFEPWQARGVLFARILPSLTALKTALAVGFTPDRIIAVRPPITEALEMALWRQWQITQVITKASGEAGGEDRKQAIAAELGIRLIRIARPAMSYPDQTDSLNTAIAYALRYCT